MIDKEQRTIPLAETAALRWALFRFRKYCRRYFVLTVSALYLAARGAIGFVRRRESEKIWTILYFHSIKDSDRHKFAEQISFIAGHAVIVPAGLKQLPDRGKRFTSLTFDDGFVSIVRNVLPSLAEEKVHITIFVPTAYLGSPPRWVKNRYYEDFEEVVMTADELRALPVDRVEIGSHSVNHPRFTHLTLQERMMELEGSKTRLEDLLKREVTLFSYPYGEGMPGDPQLARSCGYKKVFTNIPFSADQTGAPHECGRVGAAATDSMLELYLKINGGYGWLPKAMSLKRSLVAILGRVLSSRSPLRARPRERA